jgi:hypothetical protein
MGREGVGWSGEVGAGGRGWGVGLGMAAGRGPVRLGSSLQWILPSMDPPFNGSSLQLDPPFNGSSLQLDPTNQGPGPRLQGSCSAGVCPVSGAHLLSACHDSPSKHSPPFPPPRPRPPTHRAAILEGALFLGFQLLVINVAYDDEDGARYRNGHGRREGLGAAAGWGKAGVWRPVRGGGAGAGGPLAGTGGDGCGARPRAAVQCLHCAPQPALRH